MPTLSQEQQTIVNQALTGCNVLYTGPAGVGKSTVANAITATFDAFGHKYKTAAPTGQAAERIGAVTIHSLIFKDLGKQPVDHYVKMWKANKWKLRKWMYLRTIIIDEISMVGKKLFEKLDLILRGIYDKPLTPFGGLQIIACGDPYQLPPVKDDFCFDSAVFKQTFPVMHELHTVYRQRDDPEFLDALHDMRKGPMSDKTYQLLKSRLNLEPPKDMPAIRIFPKNFDVDRYNFYKLQALKGPDREFEHVWYPCPSDHEWANDAQFKKILKFGPFESTLRIKQGSFVRYTHNNKTIGKVNGSMGIVIGFEEVEGVAPITASGVPYPIVKFVDGSTCIVTPISVKSNNEQCRMIQVPLKLAWAATVHRLQGAQVDCAVIDLGENLFEFGQGYTAVSRVTSLAGLHLLALDRDSLLPHPNVLEFMRTYPRA
jgi:ATP-dependent DNA helicase PIF1